MLIPTRAQSRWVRLAVPALSVLLLTGCLQSAPDRATGATDAASPKPAGQAEDSSSLNLFAGTDYAEHPPQALDINRGGTKLFVREAAGREASASVVSYDLTADKLREPTVYVRSNELMRVFVRAHPTRDECLLIKHVQPENEPVVDQIWRHLAQDRIEVPYANMDGMPANLPPTARYNLDPFYSWDGTDVVVPLHAAGLCIVNAESSSGRFISYPEVPDIPTGMAHGALPGLGEQRLIYLARWRADDAGDRCYLNVLDLDTGEWVQEVEIKDWIAYEIAGEDVLNLPWLVRGSRAPNKNYEHFRVPRLALVDPVSGVAKLLQFYGDPYWPAALEPRGRFVVYLDRRREAIVRLDPATNSLDVDPRYYHDEAQLFVAEGGERVFGWLADTLIRAEFTEREQF